MALERDNPTLQSRNHFSIVAPLPAQKSVLRIDRKPDRRELPQYLQWWWFARPSATGTTPTTANPSGFSHVVAL
jgi:hypothetical protein